jgi:hypothetical protein
MKEACSSLTLSTITRPSLGPVWIGAQADHAGRGVGVLLNGGQRLIVSLELAVG